jgi:hypothetical protein
MRNCELQSVLVGAPGSVLEVYYSVGGSERVQRRTIQGAVVSTVHTYPENVALFVLPGCAMVVLAIATIRKIIRTGVFWSWQLARRESDRLERLLTLYSVPVLITAFAQLWLRDH